MMHQVIVAAAVAFPLMAGVLVAWIAQFEGRG